MLHGSKCKKYLMVVILFFNALGTFCWAESSQKPVVLLSASQDHLEVTITGIPEGPTTRYKIRELTIRINDKKKDEVKEILYRNYIRRLHKIEFCTPGKALIIGQVYSTGSSSGGDNLLVLDMVKGKIQDSIRAYGYSLSPSKEFLVYSSWYPRLSLPIARRSICMLYDLRKYQKGNRDRYIKRFSHENAGFPIFPEVNVYFQERDPNVINNENYQGRYNKYIDDIYYRSSSFLWSDDSKHIVFFVNNIDENAYYLIHVVLDKSAIPEIYRSRITYENYANWDVIKEADVEKLKENPHTLGIKSFGWYNNNYIIVQIRKNAYWIEKEIIMKVPSE